MYESEVFKRIKKSVRHLRRIKGVSIYDIRDRKRIIRGIELNFYLISPPRKQTN